MLGKVLGLVTGGLVEKLALAAVVAVVVGGGIFAVYHAGEEGEAAKASQAEVKEVETDIKIRGEVDEKVRDDNSGKPVADGLRRWLRD